MMSYSRFKGIYITMFALAGLCLCLSTPATAQERQSFKASVADFAGLDYVDLGWNYAQATVSFDLPETVWVEDMTLLLSARPNGKVSENTPLIVSLNGGKATYLQAAGQGFDAKIGFRKTDIRPGLNKLTIAYKTPSGSDCLSADHAKWTLNFKDSRLIVGAKGKSRAPYVKEISDGFSNAFSAPRRVTLNAVSQGHDWDALMAQSIVQHMQDVPEFNFGRSPADLVLIAGTYADLSKPLRPFASDLKQVGEVFYAGGKTPSLIFTGPTPDDVSAVIAAFGTYQTPAFKTSLSVNDLRLQAKIKPAIAGLEPEQKLAPLWNPHFENAWRPMPKTLTFNTGYATGPGEIVLDLNRNKAIANASRVDVVLNGTPLGFAELDKASKRVLFDIPSGTLRALGNEMTLYPDLAPATGTSACAHAELSPGLYLGERSTIALHASADTGLGGALTGTGIRGADVRVDLPSGANTRLAAISVLARMSHTGGQIYGHISSAPRLRTPSTLTHTISIVPPSQLEPASFSDAPRTFREAMAPGYDPTQARLDIPVAADFANIGGADMARANIKDFPGIATAYRDAFGQMTLVVTSQDDKQFTRALAWLEEPDVWQALSGNVSRWNKTQAILVQQSLPRVPQAASKPVSSTAKSWMNVSGMSASVSRWWKNVQADARAIDTQNIFTSVQSSHALQRLLIVVFGIIFILALLGLMRPTTSRRDAYANDYEY